MEQKKAIGGSSVDQTETLWYAILRNLQVTSRCGFQKAWEASVPKVTRGFRGRPAGLDGPPCWRRGRLHPSHRLAADLMIPLTALPDRATPGASSSGSFAHVLVFFFVSFSLCIQSPEISEFWMIPALFAVFALSVCTHKKPRLRAQSGNRCVVGLIFFWGILLRGLRASLIDNHRTRFFEPEWSCDDTNTYLFGLG